MIRKIFSTSILGIMSMFVVLTTSCSEDFEQFEDFDLELYDYQLSTLATRSIGMGSENPIIFPSASEIIKDNSFKQKAMKAWQNTLASLTDNSRREWGFVVYYKNGKLDFGPITSGPITTGCSETSASFSPTYDTSRQNEICAVLHTHTPVPKCCQGCKRKTGASDIDEIYSKKKGWPIIAYDFSSEYIIYKEDLSKEVPQFTYRGVSQRRAI